MSYASFKLDGISDALYQHHEYYASLHKLLRQLGITDCQDLCANISLAQFKLYQKINRDLKIEELIKEIGTPKFNPDMVTVFNYMIHDLIVTKSQYESSINVNEFIQSQVAYNKSTWEIIINLIRLVKQMNTESTQDIDDINKKIEELKVKQPKFSMKLNSFELGIPSVFKAKFERTKED